MPNRDDLIPEQRTVAYFSMEVGIDPAMPTYSGGLGVLAGDTLRAAADLGAPVVGVTLLHRKGYFRQHLDTNGTQEEYDMFLGKLLCSGVDLWLNTPQKPQEASGTSGMKAALNGVPSCSVLDGWWVEGHVEGVTGWSIGDAREQESVPAREIASLYNKLEYLILPTFYDRPAVYGQIMRAAIALNGSFFNAQRMVSQYMENAYAPMVS